MRVEDARRLFLVIVAAMLTTNAIWFVVMHFARALLLR